MHEHRRVIRLPTRFEVLYATDRESRLGTVTALSRVGAWVETHAERLPPAGVYVQLRITAAHEREIELEGCVLRHGEKGFAVDFLSATVELLELLDSLGG